MLYNIDCMVDAFPNLRPHSTLLVMALLVGTIHTAVTLFHVAMFVFAHLMKLILPLK